jgi:hypothetical protein
MDGLNGGRAAPVLVVVASPFPLSGSLASRPAAVLNCLACDIISDDELEIVNCHNQPLSVLPDGGCDWHWR